MNTEKDEGTERVDESNRVKGRIGMKEIRLD